MVLKERKLILTIGISNSGKTSWANEYLAENPNTVNLNRDDLRASRHTETNNIRDYKFKKQKEIDVTLKQFNLANIADAKGQDIIVSDTNLNPKTREKWALWASQHGYTVINKLFTTEPHICIARSLKREYTVAPHVINMQYKQLRKHLGLQTENVFIDGLEKAVIVDLDGTVADMEGVRGAFEWDKVGLDKPHEDIINLVEMLHGEGYYIIFLSGRDGSCREQTLKWITKHIAVSCWDLWLRNTGDSRADAIIKEELFDKHVKGRYNVRYVLDDREQMVQRWRAMGLLCLQVANGDF